MIPEHETFENAPIEEAVIDLHVRRDGGGVDAALKAFVDTLGPEYPTAQSRVELSIVIGPDGQPSATPSAPGWLLRSQDNRWVVLPRTGAMGVSHLRPYTSWATLEGKTRKTWDAYVTATAPAGVTRIATRFINRIVLPAGPLRMEDWFATGLRVGPDIPGEVGDLMIQATLVAGDGATAAIVIKKEPLDPLGRTPVFFDIDAALVGSFAPDDPAIWTRLQALRDLKNAIFFRSLTDRTKELFR